MTDDTITGDALLASELQGLGCDPEWLCSQLEAWPAQVDPARPVVAEDIMSKAAILIRTLLARPVADTSPRVPTGDFRCHGCKHVVENVVVAPRRCPTCGCRDFAAVPPPHVQRLIERG